jgi:general secretion pathway protein H
MPTSCASNSAGFTLIEIMAVVVLIGLALGAGLTLDFSSSPQQTVQQARRFANEMQIAAQEAVLDGAVWGLDFFAETDGALAYRWLRLEEARWTEVSVPGLDSSEALFASAEVSLHPGDVALKPEMRVALDVPTATVFTPEILLQPTREVTPFTLRLNGADAQALVISADLLGRVRIEPDAVAAR